MNARNAHSGVPPPYRDLLLVWTEYFAAASTMKPRLDDLDLSILCHVASKQAYGSLPTVGAVVFKFSYLSHVTIRKRLKYLLRIGFLEKINDPLDTRRRLIKVAAPGEAILEGMSRAVTERRRLIPHFSIAALLVGIANSLHLERVETFEILLRSL